MRIGGRVRWRLVLIEQARQSVVVVAWWGRMQERSLTAAA
jgi:hypothetical protein